MESVSREKELTALLEKHQYPQKAVNDIVKSDRELQKYEQVQALIHKFLKGYENRSLDYSEIADEIAIACEQIQVKTYTVYLLFFIALFPLLRERYMESGVSLDVYEETLIDVRIKTQECFDRYGVWGLFDTEWIGIVFEQEVYTLGRLQFQISTMPCDALVGGESFVKGETVINVHIPSGSPLKKEDCMVSFSRAKAFYGLETTVFICDSWMLNPFHKDFLPSHSNILMFMDFFEQINWREDKTFFDAWRIFGKPLEYPLEKMPQKTSLQRGYIDWIKAGNITSIGVGGFIL